VINTGHLPDDVECPVGESRKPIKESFVKKITNVCTSKVDAINTAAGVLMNIPVIQDKIAQIIHIRERTELHEIDYFHLRPEL